MEPQLDLAVQARHWLRRDRPGPRRLLCAMADEIARLRLTAAEREAVACAADHLDNCGWSSVTLRGLLDRLCPINTDESDRPQAINIDARLAALQQLAELDEELGLPRTPNPHATPGECSVPPECTETGGT